MQLHQTLGSKGVVLVGLSNETDGKVGPHIKKDKTPYIIGSGSSSAKDWGVRGYPTAFVVDPYGEVKFSGHPADPKFKKAVESTVKNTPPKPGLPFAKAEAAESYRKANKLLKKKKYTEAIKLYEMIAKDYPDTKAGTKAKKKLKKIRKNKRIMTAMRNAEAKKKCTAWLDMARSLAKAGNPGSARKYYKRIIKNFGESSYAETAKVEMAKL